MILYDPGASFIGWMALMIIVPPFLQVLITGFASLVRLPWFPPASGVVARVTRTALPEQ